MTARRIPIDTDSTMAANSDSRVSSQKATKTALAGKQSDLGVTLDTDGTLAANSDTRVPSQKAVKTAIATNGVSQPAIATAYGIDPANADEHHSDILYPSAISALTSIPVFRAPFPCEILAVSIVNYGATIAADDTNYWTVKPRRRLKRGNPLTGFGLTYQERVVADAPIRYWPLQDASGTTAAEVIASASGTYTNGPVVAQAGPTGLDSELAVSFDGVDDYVALPSEKWLLGQQPGYEIWAKPTIIAQNSARMTMIGAENAAGVPSFEMGGNQSAVNGIAVISNSITGFLVVSGDWINNKDGTNQWHYYAYWKDAQGVDHLFVDGQALPFHSFNVTPGWSYTDTTTAHAIGRRKSGTSSQNFTGSLAHAAVYAGNFSLAKAQAHWDFHASFGIRTTRATKGGPMTQYQPWHFGAYPWRTSQSRFDQGDILELNFQPDGSPSSIAGPLLVSVRYGRI